jgi:hypothetical protein
MCSYGLKAKEAETVQESEKLLPDEEAQKLAEFEAHVVRAINQFEAGLGKTFDDKDEFLNYLRNL